MEIVNMTAGNPNMKAGLPSVNKRGRPPGVFSTFSDTAGRLMEGRKRSEIICIAKDDEKLDEFHPFESMVLMHLADSMQRTPTDKIDTATERDRFYNRVLGKPKETIEQTTVSATFVVVGNAVDELPENVREKLRHALEKTAPMIENGDK